MIASQRTIQPLIGAIAVSVLLLGSASATEPVKAKPKDKCAVCGMFVAPYPQWTAEVLFKDGSYAVFDGPKDMLKYYLNMSAYEKNKTAADIAGLFVTEYYTTRMMNAREVLFVTGSDVRGPMGAELVPVRGKEHARTFLQDHRGRTMLKFEALTLKDIP